jgi:hypothetical protein
LDRGSSLEGELIGSDDKPAQGVDVVLQGAQGFWRTTTTDENGTFSFTGLHPGKYVLGTGLLPHERMARTVRISSNEVKSIILQPYAGTSMHGTVSAGGKPVSCTVTAFGMARGEGLVSIRSALSDEEGEFTLHGLSSDGGRVNVLMFALPLEPGTTSVLERLHIPKGSGEVERTFSLPTGKVRASVRDLSDSAIVGATLTVSQIGVLHREDATELARILGGVNASSAETGTDGKVEVRYLSPGKYQVSVMKKGYRPSHHQVTVKQDEEVDLGVMGLQRIASQPGTVVGRVKGASGRPLRALLILSDSDGIPVDQTHSGLDGRFSFGGLEPGKYSVAGEGETPGFTTLGDIQVSEDRATQVEVSLRHD